MRCYPGAQKSIACMVVLAFGMLSVLAAPLQAAMVDTGDILAAQSYAQARKKVQQFFEREDVAQKLTAWGVSPQEAKARVDTLTDQEVSQLADRIDQLPSGGDALSLILTVAVVCFVVLIITDVLGVTDVFTFIKKR